MKARLPKIAFAILGVLLIGAIAVQLFKKNIGLGLAERAIERQMQRDLLSELPDGLHVGFCGTGSPFPDPSRAGPCVAVIAGTRIFVVDSGSGSTGNLAFMGVPVGEVEAVFLSHYHSDHIADLGELMMQRWIAGANSSPLYVFGPPGVEEVVGGFNAAYRLDQTYRTAHHGPIVAPSTGAGGVALTVELGSAENASVAVVDEGDLKITMFKVDHDPVSPAVGYRFDYKDRSVVISGDTSYSASVIEHAEGADILVHDGLQQSLVTLINEAASANGREVIETIAADILDYHATPEQAAEAAELAGVRHLVFYHMVPPLPSKFLHAAYLGAAPGNFSGDITISEDGMIFSLPANGDRIGTRKGF